MIRSFLLTEMNTNETHRCKISESKIRILKNQTVNRSSVKICNVFVTYTILSAIKLYGDYVVSLHVLYERVRRVYYTITILIPISVGVKCF